MNELVSSPMIKDEVNLRLRRIADALLLNNSLMNNPGLLNGKMGIAIFIYNYAHETDNETYKNYAGELIDEIYEGISVNTTIDFANGLTGIGWGIEYLVRNKFVEADTDEALAEIDNAIYQEMMQRPVLTHDGNGLFSYGFYYLARLFGKENGDDNINTLIKKQILIHLADECERLLIFKRFLDFNIKTLNLGMINSLAWFIIEMHKLGLFPSKINKLLNHLPSELEYIIGLENDPVEQYVLYHLIQDIIPLVKDTKIQKKYRAYAKMMIASWKDLNPNDDRVTEIFSSLSWHKLIYNHHLKEDKALLAFNDRAFSIINNEENWSSRLDRLNEKNIGLNGLAGLGLGLLGWKG